MWMTKFVRKFIFSNARCLNTVITILMIWSVILRVTDLMRKQTGVKIRHFVRLLLNHYLLALPFHTAS